MAETAVAVRELVAFCHRSGDIDQRFQASPTAADGQRGHREVAGRRPSGWEAEVALSHRWSDGDRTLLLRGRADGVQRDAALVACQRVVVILRKVRRIFFRIRFLVIVRPAART